MTEFEIEAEVAAIKKTLDHLYFIQSGEGGPIKVGRTKNVPARLQFLQTGNPERLTLLHVAEAEGWQEYIWHRAFASTRLTGEWFSPTQELLDAVDEWRESWAWPRALDRKISEVEMLLDMIDQVGDVIYSERAGSQQQREVIKRVIDEYASGEMDDYLALITLWTDDDAPPPSHPLQSQTRRLDHG